MLAAALVLLFFVLVSAVAVDTALQVAFVQVAAEGVETACTWTGTHPPNP